MLVRDLFVRVLWRRLIFAAIFPEMSVDVALVGQRGAGVPVLARNLGMLV
jgi:hypothetical protein